MKLLLGVTGSVAAILTPKLVHALTEKMPSIELNVIATERSRQFFNFETLPATVFTDSDEWLFECYEKDVTIPHIDLGVWADCFLIAPLTAHTLSAMAHGKTNTLLTSTVLAWPREKEMFLAPAMNTRMWENPITQDNLRIVVETYGAHVHVPEYGTLACKTEGIGAMARIVKIVHKINEYEHNIEKWK